MGESHAMPNIGLASRDRQLPDILRINRNKDRGFRHLAAAADAVAELVGARETRVRRIGHGFVGVGRRAMRGLLDDLAVEVVAVLKDLVVFEKRYHDGLAIASLLMVVNCHHGFDVDGALLVVEIHELAKRDVVQAEIVATACRVLVEDGDDGRGGRAAVPDFVELCPSVQLVRCREDVAKLCPVDAELQQGHLVGVADADVAGPCGEGVVGVGHHRNRFRPDIRPGTRGPVDDHEHARAAVGQAREPAVVVVGVGTDIVGAFAPQVGIVLVRRDEPHVALLEVAVDDALRARAVARAGVGRRHLRRGHRHRSDGGGKASGGRPQIERRARGRQRYRLARLDISHWWRDDYRLGLDEAAQPKQQHDEVAFRFHDKPIWPQI